MADKELELTPRTYIFAGIGAAVFSILGGIVLGSGPIGYLSAAIVGAIVGGGMGLFI